MDILGRLARTIAGGAWIACQAGHSRALSRALARPREAQEARLGELIARNARTRYGETYGFASIDGPVRFQERVPVTTYEDLEPWIERIKSGEQGVLTAEPVLMFEKTGGSASPAKYIPYTESLRAEFGRAVGAWLLDLHVRRPSLIGKRSAWSVSPSAREREVTAGGRRVGFDDDTEYFGGLARRLLGLLLVVPREASRLTHMETSRYVTLRFLLAAADLGMISVWSPSYLSLLLDRLDAHAQRLIDDVRLGLLRPPPVPEEEPASPARASAVGPATPRAGEPVALTAGVPQEATLAALARHVQPDPGRAARLERILADRGRFDPKTVWPGLELVSCWTGGASRALAAQLASRLPGVAIEPKGLLATEGVVTVPLGPAASGEGAAPALTSHFLEFQPAGDPAARPRFVWELDEGERYTVLLTTGGGLYRYALGDEVRVTGRIGASPRLEFEGRGAGVSDLAGEKLSEAMVGRALARALVDAGHCGGFVLLVPRMVPAPHYVLVLDAPAPDRPGQLGLADCVDAALSANPQYAYCRRLGQLGTLEVVHLGPRAQDWYDRICRSLGQKPGSIKPSHLRKELAFGEALDRERATPA